MAAYEFIVKSAEGARRATAGPFASVQEAMAWFRAFHPEKELVGEPVAQEPAARLPEFRDQPAPAPQTPAPEPR